MNGGTTDARQAREISLRWLGVKSRGATYAERDYDELAVSYDPIVAGWG